MITLVGHSAGPRPIAFVAVGVAVLALVLLLGQSGCAHLQTGPFVSNPPHYCNADPDCPDHSACRFPCRMPDLHGAQCAKVCMTGRESDIYAWRPD